MLITPTVSVLMPVYNGEKYLAQAIASILNQTFRDFELLLIDDGSTDRSRQIIENFADQDARICYQYQENRGMAATLNVMLDQSQGEFLARMDADDVALPERFERQVHFLQKNPDVVCLGGCFQLIDAQGRLLTTLKLPEDDATIQRLALAGHGSICHPAAMIRRTTLVAIGGYDATLTTASDLDLWLRLGEVGRLANLPDVILQYRLHSDSVSEQKRLQQRQNALHICQRAWQRRGIEGKFEAVQPWRPGSDRQSQHQFLLKYGWWAFGSSQRFTALLYGFRAIFTRPLAISGWKLLLCASLKPLPKQKV